MSVSVFPRGVTIYNPSFCDNGYTVFACQVDKMPGARMIDMNGRVVHEWRCNDGGVLGNAQRARLLPNGNILVLRGGVDRLHSGAQEYDWEGNLVWEYQAPEGTDAHHDIFRKDNGNTLLICREEVPELIRARAADPERRAKLYSDVILEVSPSKEIVWQWHQYEHLDIDRCNPVPASRGWWAGPDNNTITDWTHTNTVQAIPPNQWYDGGDARFKPGNVLISLRQLDVVLLIDRDSGKIVWEYTGDYNGGMSGQHDSHMIEPGYPGEGNVIIFDNGSSPTRDLAHAGCSYVLEVNPTNDRLVWVYDKRERFHSNFTCSCQRLKKGTTLILELAGERIFEVTPDCETVWEYVFPDARATRAYRYPYDYCPQTAALGTPAQRAVERASP